MKNSKYFQTRVRSAAVAVVCALLLAGLAPTGRSASWNNIEPLKSRRADVERALGKPVQNQPGETGTLRFKVAGGQVTVAFVTARFIQTKQLAPDLEGTVLQVVLQHENAKDTPDSLNITNNSDFEREERDTVTHYRNPKEGISYTFVGGRLKTTWFTAAAEQLARARVRV
ncbi:MAG TPA: hypothetical protein VER08_03545 [Pyrinomonadaceae bacterium]|nr:hypothetical protein [Pyrinomonadaceae bacterium]